MGLNMHKRSFFVTQIEVATINEDTRLSLRAVELLTGYRRSSIYEKVKSHTFPAPVSRGRWRAGDIHAWLSMKDNKPQHQSIPTAN